MQTNVNYKKNTPTKPDGPDFAVGQYWKHINSGDLYIIGEDCGRYMAVCLTGESDIGDSYEYITNNIEDVLCQEHFEFVPSITIQVP